MAYDNEQARTVVFDIETAPLEDAATFLEPAEAPKNYTDPIKITAYLEKANAEAVGKCSLDPDLCRVVAIGVWDGVTQEPMALTLGDMDEAAILKGFWATTIGGAHLVGFNCIAFDLPVLFRRSLYLGIDVPRIAIDKYRHPRVTDLLQVLSYSGTLRLRGLSFYTKRFGIVVPDTITGADIPQAVAEGRWADVEAHVLADVKKTGLLAARMGLFSLPGQNVVSFPREVAR